MATVEYRKWDNYDRKSVEVRKNESWEEALTRAYNAELPKFERRRHVALAEHFVGGSTWHVQMGYRLGRSGDAPTTLDEKLVVNVNND